MSISVLLGMGKIGEKINCDSIRDLFETEGDSDAKN